MGQLNYWMHCMTGWRLHRYWENFHRLPNRWNGNSSCASPSHIKCVIKIYKNVFRAFHFSKRVPVPYYILDKLRHFYSILYQILDLETIRWEIINKLVIIVIVPLLLSREFDLIWRDAYSWQERFLFKNQEKKIFEFFFP